MANFLSRSPIYIVISAINADRAELDITINGDTGINTYTFNKPCVDNKAIFEVSDLIREGYNITMPTYQSNDISIVNVSYATQTFYQGVGSIPSTGFFVAFDGYSDSFSLSRSNAELPIGVLQSNMTIYAPENVPLWTYISSVSGVALKTFTSTEEGIIIVNNNGNYYTFNIVRDCSMYDPIQVTFVNKYGLKQAIFLNRKSVKGIAVSSDRYKSGMYALDGTAATDRPVHKYNVIGRENLIGNTGYVNDEYAEVMKELLLSEQVWIAYNLYDATPINVPVNVTTSSVTYMNSLNDKLCNYTLEFEMAFDAINNLR